MTVVILNRKHRRFVTTIALLVFSSMLTHTIYRHIFPYAPKSGFKVRPPLAKKQSVKVENHVAVAYDNAFDDVTTNFPTVPKVIINLSPVSKIYRHLFPKNLIKEHSCDINAGTDLPKHPINCVWRDQILYGRPPDGIIWFGKPKPETLRYYKSGQRKTPKQPFIINPIKTRQIYFSLEPIVPKLFIPEVGDQIDLFFGFEDENIKAANNVPVSRLSSEIDQQIKRYKAPATSQRQFQMAFYSPACRYMNSNIITYIENMKKYMPIHIFDGCLKNADPKKLFPDCKTRSCILSHYYFALSIEKYNVKNYVSETFYLPLTVGTIPVYRGILDISKYAPSSSSYVDGNAFKKGMNLARHLLSISKDKRKLRQYSQNWRYEEFSEGYNRTLGINIDTAVCRVCKQIYKKII